MSRPPRRCLTCGTPTTNGTRCPAHTRTTRQAKGYGATYQVARTALLAGRPLCWKCDQLATTADHVPPLRSYPSPDLWRGVLKPACAKHNYGRSAKA